MTGSLHDDFGGVVVGVVNDLNLKAVARPVEARHGINDATGHVTLVVDRDLHADRFLFPLDHHSRFGRLEPGRQPGEPKQVESKTKQHNAGHREDGERDQ